MEPVTEYQILFNVSADRDDFFTECKENIYMG